MLWSGLRNLGAPILGNDVQAAPLFPLTLALAWLPDPYFWNAFVAVRLVLMWFGAFMVATTVLKLERMPAFVFTVCFVGTVEVARWINHSWQNGLTAGIWLLYFIGQAFVLSALPWGRRRFFNTLALAFCTYALLTCGFPEATLLAVLLGMLVFAPILIVFLLQKHAASAPARLFSRSRFRRPDRRDAGKPAGVRARRKHLAGDARVPLRPWPHAILAPSVSF